MRNCKNAESALIPPQRITFKWIAVFAVDLTNLDVPLVVDDDARGSRGVGLVSML